MSRLAIGLGGSDVSEDTLEWAGACDARSSVLCVLASLPLMLPLCAGHPARALLSTPPLLPSNF